MYPFFVFVASRSLIILFWERHLFFAPCVEENKILRDAVEKTAEKTGREGIFEESKRTAGRDESFHEERRKRTT
jgi:hypothetical protein